MKINPLMQSLFTSCVVFPHTFKRQVMPTKSVKLFLASLALQHLYINYLNSAIPQYTVISTDSNGVWSATTTPK